MQQKNDPAVQEKLQQEAEKEAAKKQQENAKNAPAAPSGPVDPNANEVSRLGTGEADGKPGGSPKITVGWAWTPAIQGNPADLFGCGMRVTKGNAKLPRLQVVNLDAKPTAVRLGSLSW